MEQRRVEMSGKAVQDKPTDLELAQDFAASRSWTQVAGRNALFDPNGNLQAVNLSELAIAMRKVGGFVETALGTTQINPQFHSYTDAELSDVLRL